MGHFYEEGELRHSNYITFVTAHACPRTLLFTLLASNEDLNKKSEFQLVFVFVILKKASA